MSRLFLVDGYALIYRAFFAMLTRPLTTGRGENTSVAWGISNFLLRLADKHHPDYVAWVNDAGSSFRHEALPEYKATREKLNAELQQDFDQSVERVQQLLRGFRVPLVAVDGYEADDVIATLAERSAAAGVDVVIVSGDKDFYQLIGPRIALLNPGRGGPAAVEEHLVTEANAAERFGVPPERIVDYLALVGDSSDNVPGVTGIGEKTAQKLITEFGDLDAILARAAEVSAKRPRESLLTQGDRARLSRQLVTLHRDVPVNVELTALKARPPDFAALLPMFRELEFHTLVRSLADRASAPATAAGGTGADETAASSGTGAGGAGAPPAAAASPPGTSGPGALTTDDTRAAAELAAGLDDESAAPAGAPVSGAPLAGHYELADAPETLGVALAALRAGGPIGIALATAGRDAMRAELIGIALATRGGRAWYLPFGHRAPGEFFAPETLRNLPPLSDAAIEPLIRLLGDPEVAKVGHDIKPGLLVLRRQGVTLRGVAFDTMIASFMIEPGRRSHDLDAVAAEYLGATVRPLADLTGRGKDLTPLDEASPRAVADLLCAAADGALRLRERLEPVLHEHVLAPLFERVELPLIGVLADMEWEGIGIDAALFESLTREFRADLAALEQRIHQAAGTDFNIASTPQLRHVLFEKLQLPVIKKTKTGPSTDADVLDELAAQGHEVPKLLLEYREVSKLLSTYLESLPQTVNPATGRIHTSFNQIGSATGRLSSTEPNLQNIPVRTPRGEAIRRGFVPREGNRFVVADYSQIELRLLAHLSGDAAFVEAFNRGGDIHRQTAAIIFGVGVDDVSARQRAQAKTINFATIYGQGAHSLSRVLGISRDEAKRFIDEYFTRFAGVRQFLDTCVELARTRGYAETMFGRRRYIPELKDRNFNMRAFGERTAANSPLQGSAADLIKIAMVRVRDALAAGYRGRLLLQVHDELVVEAPAAEAERVAALVKQHMEGAASLSVPLVADIGIGTNWLDAKG